MSKKIFAFDVDGTLLNDKHVLTQATKDMLVMAHNKGHKLILCSGRPIADMTHVAEEAKVFDFMICNNGTYFYDLNKNELIIENEIKNQITDEIIEFAKESETMFVLHTTTVTHRGLFFGDKTPEWAEKEIKAEWYKFPISTLDQIHEAKVNSKVTQLSLRADLDTINKVFEKAHSKFSDKVNVSISSGVYLDFNLLNINKFVGLKELAKREGWDIKDIVAFGDSGNDIEMLSGVGIGIAMGNATEEAKKAAKIVIGSNDTNALSEKVMEYI